MGGAPYVYKECVVEEAGDLERLTVDVAVLTAMKPRKERRRETEQVMLENERTLLKDLEALYILGCPSLRIS